MVTLLFKIKCYENTEKPMITGILKSPVNSNLLLQNPRDSLLLLLLFCLVSKMCLTLLEPHGLWPAGLLSHGI